MAEVFVAAGTWLILAFIVLQTLLFNGKPKQLEPDPLEDVPDTRPRLVYNADSYARYRDFPIALIREADANSTYSHDATRRQLRRMGVYEDPSEMHVLFASPEVIAKFRQHASLRNREYEMYMDGMNMEDLDADAFWCDI